MRIVLTMAVTCLSIISLAVAADAQASIKKFTNIPAQGLGPALQTLAKERKLSLVYVSEEINPRRTVGVLGEFTAEEALRRLLDGTGLTYRYLNDETVTIVPEVTAPVSLNKGDTGSGQMQLAEQNDQNNQATTSTAAANATSAQETEQAPASSEQSLDSSANKIQEIVVTAQKREERLQDVPISMSVVDGVELDRSTALGMQDVLKDVPGVAIYQGGNPIDSEIRIRGVGGQGIANSAPVGLYFDGAPYGGIQNPTVPDISAYDLDRIEVLRGPQGTLYGASAQVGVVRLLSKDADLNDFELKARANYSNTQWGGDNMRFDSAINMPIVEGKLGARAVLGYHDLSGWIDKPTRPDANSANVRNARLKFNAQLTDSLKLALWGWVSRYENDSWDMDSTGAANARRSLTDDIDFSESEFDTYALNIAYDASAFSLTSTTSYISSLMRIRLGIGVPSALAVVVRNEVPQSFTQEINLASKGDGPWRWTAGTIYQDVQAEWEVSLPPFLNVPSIQEQTSKSWAVFGELTREFLDGKLAFTAGLRYFEDDRGLQELSRLGGGVQPGEYVSNDNTFDATSPRLILTWKPHTDLTAYASYAEGFRSGKLQLPENVLVLPSLPDAEPDTLTNYELGVKGTLFGGHLDYDLAVYYMDWTDVQLPLLYQDPSTDVSVLAVVNGPAMVGPGIDAALTFTPVERLELRAGYSENDLHMEEDVYSGDVVLFPKGSRNNGSPSRTISASAKYTFPFGKHGLQGILEASANLQSSWDFMGIVGSEVANFATAEELVIGRVSFGVSSNRWQATLFADNVNNEQGSPNRYIPPYSTDRDTQIRPRTIGVQFEYRL